MHNPTTKPDTCPVATPGCACLPPGRRIHHLGILDIWLLLKFCSDFATKHMRPPRQALPSFHGEMVFCRDFRESGRGGEIRTHDPLYPKQVRYQTAPRPDTAPYLGNWIKKEKGFSHTAGGFFVSGQSSMTQNSIRTYFQSCGQPSVDLQNILRQSSSAQWCLISGNRICSNIYQATRRIEKQYI